VTNTNEVLLPIHDRMRVILPEEQYHRWLDPKSQDVAELQALVRPYPSEEMVAFPIGTFVNSVKSARTPRYNGSRPIPIARAQPWSQMASMCVSTSVVNVLASCVRS
jgi:hypothetical protein